MECNQKPGDICDNMDMENCKKCIAPRVCFCTRPEVRKMIQELWKVDVKKEVNHERR